MGDKIMRLLSVSFTLCFFLFCFKGMGQADFKPNKADDLSRVNRQIKMLTEFRDCLQKATGMIALRDCHKNQKVSRKNLKKAHRKSMKARIKKEIEDRCSHRRARSKRNISMERCIEGEMKRMKRQKRGRMNKGRGRGRGRGELRGRGRRGDRDDRPFDDGFDRDRLDEKGYNY